MLNNEILHKVIRPARYTGGECNSIIKDWDKIPIKIALAYPDTYEVGMSNMAVPILYKSSTGGRTLWPKGFTRRGWIWKRRCGTTKSPSSAWKASGR